MQMKKRVLSAFMALCMVCSLVGAAWAVIPQQTSAAGDDSTFHITWSQKGTTYFDVTVHYVDENGNSIPNVTYKDVPIDVSNNEPQEYAFANYAQNIDGYEYQYSKYSGDDSFQNAKEVIRMVASQSSGIFGSTTRQLTFYNSASGTSDQVDQLTYYYQEQTADVYLVYQKKQEGFYIKDMIATDGLFTATFGSNITIPSDATVEYTWYRSETGAEGTWQKVELQRVTGTQDNIVNDGQSVNVAYDSIAANAENSERYWYYVTATVTSNGDSEVYTAEPLQVPYYIELQNGSFEAPVADHWNNQVSNGTEDLIWQTTGIGQGTDSEGNSRVGHDIEIVRSTNEKFSDEGQQKTYQKKVEEIYSPSSAADGVQFAELNCEAYGALYQDVLTVPGVDLNWYLEHCARQGTDTMALVIMPATEAYELTQRLENIANGSGSNKAQQIKNALNAVANESDDVFLDYYEAGTRTWRYHNGTYTVPANQYLTRFFFVAVSTGSGNATVGNLLDNVGFGTDVPEPQKDQGILTVTKYVDGYVPGSDYSVTVNAGDESFTFNDFRLDSVTGKYYASHTFTYQMEAYDTQIVRVSETVSGAPTDYTATSTVAVGGGQATTGQSTSATITAGATQTVTFTNTYQQLEPLTPEHNKYIKDNGDGTYDLSLNVTGTISESTEKIPINVLYVLDESYSMMWDMNGTYPGGSENDGGDDPEYANEYSFERYKAAVAAITELNNTLAENNSLNVQVALVPFAREAYTNEIVNWQELNADNVADFNSTKLPEAVWETFASGTNYYDALTKAQQLVADPPENGGETIVIFVTDGEPNWPREDGIHEDLVYAQNQAEVAARQLTCDRFYAIGVGDENFEQNLKDLVAAIDEENVSTSAYYKSSDSDELVRYFQEIAADITSVDCTNVVITDTLSQWAELVNESAAPQITLVNSFTNDTRDVDVSNVTEEENGTYTCTGTFTSNNKPQTLTYTYNSGTKTFTLEFPDTYALENGWTYTITVKIQPTEGAYQYYATNNSYPNTGEENTDAPGNSTSSNQLGFYSNTTADLTYNSNGLEDVKEEYPKPVIQVKLGKLTLAKQVNGLENGDSANDVEFTFTVTGPKTAVGYQGFVAGANNTATKQVTVTPGNSVTLNNLPYGTYTVTESDPASEIVSGKYYFVSKTDSATVDLGTDTNSTNDTATITNTYAPYRTVTITKDVGGNMGDTTHPFNFTTSITPKDDTECSLTQSTQTNATLSSNTTSEGATATWTDSGYTLADGDTLTITKLKDGDVITLKETDGNSNGYTTVYKIAETNLEFDSNGNATHTVNGDANIVVTNTRNVGTPTGFFEDNLPFTLMISAAGLAGIALIATILVRRQRRRRE